MQQSIGQMIVGVFRVVFLRGSPERVHYSQLRFYFALGAAFLASAGVQWFFHNQHVVFVILRVFAELIMFMLMVVLLTRKVARFRLTYMMLLLLLINLFGDLFLLGLAPVLPQQAGTLVAVAVGAVVFYGAASVSAWAQQAPLLQGVVVIGLYVAAVTGLDMAFQYLYNMVAGLA